MLRSFWAENELIDSLILIAGPLFDNGQSNISEANSSSLTRRLNGGRELALGIAVKWH
jgi:hypothetical protein